MRTGSVASLLRAVDADPSQDLVVDLDAMTATRGGTSVAVSMPEGARTQLVGGTWDATRILVDALPKVRETADRLPYVGGFAR